MPGEKVLRLCAASTTFLEMGMGSPDNRREADDSCQALCVGSSMSELLHRRQLD